MLRILDRYVLRELMAPFGLSLLLLTFALEIPPILQHGEALIAEGASWDIVVRVLATLVPQALGITIPMALLVGLLITLGRLSGDREIVAMEACGVSLGRLLRPLLMFGLIATAATTYVMIVALPFANQAFREITFKLLMTRGETKIKPRVFYTEFPNLVIYVREVTPGVGWTDVMVSESSTPTQPKTYLAKRGRLLLDESKRSVQMVLYDGSHHSVNLDEPAKYEQGTFAQTTLVIDPESVFPRTGPMKGYTEMTIAELRSEMAELRKQNIYPHNQIMAWQKKYSIPAACLAFMLVALGMGVSHRRDGRLAAFVLGIGVVFVYWVLMYMSESIAKAGVLPYWFAWLAMWVPNIVVGLWGLVLIVRKLRAPEQSSMKLALPFVRRRGRSSAGQDGAASPAKGARVVVVLKIPHIAFPRPSILDWYVLKQGLRVVGAGRIGTACAVLYRQLHRSVGSLVQGADNGVRCGDVSVVGVAAICLLPRPACGVDGRAGDDRRAHQEHRAGGDESVRHQPVPFGRSPADSRDHRQRDSPRPGRRCARGIEPPRRRHQQHHSRAVPDGDRSESSLGRRRTTAMSTNTCISSPARIG